MSIPVKFATGAIMAIWIAAPASAVTPIRGSMALQAHASLQQELVVSTSSYSGQWIGSVRALSTYVLAKAVNPVSKKYVRTVGQGRFTGSALKGNILFGPFGWSSNDRDPADNSLGVYLNARLPDWQYQFTANNDGTIVFTYDVKLKSGYAFGLNGWNIGWDGPQGGVSLTDPFNPVKSGTIVRQLIAGQTYNISLTNELYLFGGLQAAGTGPTFGGMMSGRFTYNIYENASPQVANTLSSAAPVSEPQTWALFILGFAVSGCVMRKKRPILA